MSDDLNKFSAMKPVFEQCVCNAIEYCNELFTNSFNLDIEEINNSAVQFLANELDPNDDFYDLGAGECTLISRLMKTAIREIIATRVRYQFSK